MSSEGPPETTLKQAIDYLRACKITSSDSSPLKRGKVSEVISLQLLSTLDIDAGERQSHWDKILESLEVISKAFVEWRRTLASLERPPHPETLDEMVKALEDTDESLENLAIWLEECTEPCWNFLRSQIWQIIATYRSLPIRSALSVYCQHRLRYKDCGDSAEPESEELAEKRFKVVDGLGKFVGAINLAICDVRDKYRTCTT